MGICSGGELSWGELSQWGFVLVMSCPGEELSRWGFVLVESCPGGELS